MTEQGDRIKGVARCERCGWIAPVYIEDGSAYPIGATKKCRCGATRLQILQSRPTFPEAD